MEEFTMMRFKLTIAFILAIVTCSYVSGSVVDYLRQEPQEELFYPEKLNHRFLLADEEKGIESHIEYYKDAVTRVVAEIKYKNGKITYLYYREKLQTLEKVLDYRTDEATGKHIPVAEYYLAENGRDFTKHLAYREDGTLERKGERLEDGNYKTIYYAADGVGISIVKLFDKNKTLIKARGFYLDGTTRFVSEWNMSHIVTKHFRQDGSNLSTVENHYSIQRGIFYEDDGKTPRVAFSRNSKNTELIYFDDKQNPRYKVTYHPVRIEVSVIENGRLLYVQTLVHRSDRSKKISHCEGDNRILKVAEISKSSMMPYQIIVDQLFILSDDGKKPIQVVIPHGGRANTIYHLDIDGIVTDIEYEGIEDGKTVDESKNKYKIGDKVDYNPDMFALLEFECVEIPEKIEVPQLRTFKY